jgi:8-oxo-dGTP pyrophosphatase MutT (NUDIX family)
MGFEPVVVSTVPVEAGGFFRVEHLTFESDGARFSRDVLRHPGAVAVLAFDGVRVVLIRQWRAPLGRTIVEIPAGTCDVEGELLAATARRELIEEAGVSAARLEPLCTVWSSPGWCDQTTVVFLATELTEVPREPAGPEEAGIEVLWVPLPDALAMLDDDGPHDATAALAIRTLVMRQRP